MKKENESHLAFVMFYYDTVAETFWRLLLFDDEM